MKNLIIKNSFGLKHAWEKWREMWNDLIIINNFVRLIAKNKTLIKQIYINVFSCLLFDL